MADEELKEVIINWRKEIWKRDFEDGLFGPSAILSNNAIGSLFWFGSINTLIGFETALGGY